MLLFNFAERCNVLAIGMGKYDFMNRHPLRLYEIAGVVVHG